MTADSTEQLTKIKVTRALLSVSDKSGISDLASRLHKLGIELISTGGTARMIRDSCIPVADVSELTGFPECLNGRVKTLHPKIHGALLARPALSEHARTLKELGIRPIQLVIVNLYPFREAIASRPDDPEHAVENIDIGGPAMVRASAKNLENVCVATHPDQYADLLDELENNDGEISPATRAAYSALAFRLTSDYDDAIATYLARFSQVQAGKTGRQDDIGTRGVIGGADNVAGQRSVADQHGTPSELNIHAPLYRPLRYGENPHQSAAIYGNPDRYIDCFHGKELSYNNYLDIDAALQLGADFQACDAIRPSGEALCAIFKHSLPCGVALAENTVDAWSRAFSTDTVSPFGGIILFDRTVDEQTAEQVDTIFSEIVLAPDFTRKALELLKRKSNRRLIRIIRWPDGSTPRMRSVTGGFLWQHEDTGFNDEPRNVVTRIHPDPDQSASLEFAWIVAKHVKSNAIVYASGRQTIGIGTGQPNRVDSSRIAAQKAAQFGHDLRGSVVASDAFFPFADGLEEAASAGATAVIQPGGSVRDKEVIRKADELQVAMVLTGTRHFRH